MSTAELLKLVLAAPPQAGPVRVVAIDGGAGAGKTSLAAELAARLPDAAVLHLDDLLDGWAGQFNYRDRLRAEVLRPLSRGEPGRYRRYDWVTGSFGDPVDLPVPHTLLVEGVSAIWGCTGYLALAVFLDRSRAVRLRRWIDRDGPLQPEWLHWLDAEDTFFAEHPYPPSTVLL